MTIVSETLTFVMVPLMGPHKFLWHLFCKDAIARVMWHVERVVSLGSVT